MAARVSASNKTKTDQSSRQSSNMGRSQQSQYTETHSRQSSAKTVNSRQRFKLPQFKTVPKDTQKIDPDSSMYNEEKLVFSHVGIRSAIKI